jgi:hypothetical protein
VATFAFAAAVAVVAMPRAGWLAISALAATAFGIHGDWHAALVLAAGALMPVVLLPRDGPAWPLAIGAPLLAALQLPTAWPS